MNILYSCRNGKSNLEERNSESRRREIRRIELFLDIDVLINNTISTFYFGQKHEIFFPTISDECLEEMVIYYE